MLGNRTRISLAQYLSHQQDIVLDLLFDKHGLTEAWRLQREFFPSKLEALVNCLREAPMEGLLPILEEIAATEPSLYEAAVDSFGNGGPAYRARWQDLVRCLALDKYVLARGQLTALEPDLEGASHVEDALSAEIRRSGLPSADGIVTLLEQSATAFRQAVPNYNACLSNVRTALQTMAAEIAVARQAKSAGGSFQPDKFGQVLSYLRTSGLITKQEEELVSAVYGFISAGAHRPVGLSEEEMARLGRGMAVSSCYFLIKLHNA
jgi:hypothetical protein